MWLTVNFSLKYLYNIQQKDKLLSWSNNKFLQQMYKETSRNWWVKQVNGYLHNEEKVESILFSEVVQRYSGDEKVIRWQAPLTKLI